MTTPSSDDLDWASDWIGCYDPDPDDPEEAERIKRVVAWLDARADTRRKAGH